jgi:hypothetical protein
MLSNHVQYGRCVVFGAGPGLWSITDSIKESRLFAEVIAVDSQALVLPGDSHSVQVDADWYVEVLPHEIRRSLHGFWDLGLVNVLTLGLIPLVRVGDDIDIPVRVRRCTTPAEAARTVEVRLPDDAVCGWVSYLLALSPEWETDDLGSEAPRRSGDRVAVELLKAMEDAPQAASGD